VPWIAKLSLPRVIRREEAMLKAPIKPFLMFSGARHGKAEEAINFYVSIMPGSRIVSIERYGPGQAQPEGTVRVATFVLNGQEFMAIDSAMPHPFNFTPSISFFLTLADIEPFDRLVARLSEGGAMLMPPDNYGFSRKFAASRLARSFGDVH
jgi:predicted 3-demethylubiquinone-9 3-methyltransferase (glyoxalase superfamily)